VDFRKQAQIQGDDENEDGKKITESKQQALQLYDQWWHQPIDRHRWIRIELETDNDDAESILARTVNVSLYATGVAPCDKEQIGRLMERRVDHATLNLGMMVYGSARSLHAGTFVTQLSKGNKLGVMIHLDQSKWNGTSLCQVLNQVTDHEQQVYTQQVTNAREWAFRMAKLANLQFYTIHPTRRYLCGEQSLRKFNASYFMSTDGTPLPGGRWFVLQLANLSAFNVPTLLAFLRVVLLSERVTYLPEKCVSKQRARLMAKRLVIAMAALPSRACAYMADCIDRCTPTLIASKPLTDGELGMMELAQEVEGIEAMEKAHSLQSTQSAKGNRGMRSTSTAPMDTEISYDPYTAKTIHYRTEASTLPLTHLQGREKLALYRHPSIFAGANRKTLHKRLARNKFQGEGRDTSSPVQLILDGYTPLSVTDADTLFQQVVSNLKQEHVVESTDEYDGHFDCPHPTITCNDCETQSFTSARCFYSLKRVFRALKKDDSVEGATSLEQGWFNEIQQLFQETELECVAILCAISSSAMEDGGKRDTVDAYASLRTTKDADKRLLAFNLPHENRLETNSEVVSLQPLTVSGDGSNWSWWPSPAELESGYDVQTRRMARTQSASGQRLAYLDTVEASPKPMSFLSSLWSTQPSQQSRMYEGERTKHSPDLGCHVCAATIEWPILYTLAVRGIVIEKYVQETKQPLSETHVSALMESWKKWRPPFDTTVYKSKQSVIDDPALLLMESTEYSQAQQVGSEKDGQDVPHLNADETKFFRFFKQSFGSPSALFLYRLPLSLTREYNMYHSAMEFSSTRLQETFGCGNWILYNLNTGRHALDFRHLFSFSNHEMLYTKEGLGVALRPSSPLMSVSQYHKLTRTLWPLERVIPLPPQIPNVQSKTDESVLAGVKVSERDTSTVFTLFINPVHWETHDPLYGNQTISHLFHEWAKTNHVSVKQETMRVHGFLDLVVLYCSR